LMTAIFSRTIIRVVGSNSLIIRVGGPDVIAMHIKPVISNQNPACRMVYWVPPNGAMAGKVTSGKVVIITGELIPQIHCHSERNFINGPGEG
jgi:hypothetical protein